MQILSFPHIFLIDNGSLTNFSSLYYKILQIKPYLSEIPTDSTRSKVVKYRKESLQHWTGLLDEGIVKTCKKIKGRQRQDKKLLPDGLDWLCYLAGTSKSYCQNNISCIFHNFCRDFLLYFTTLDTYLP